MAVGETKTVRLPAAEAYGERNKDMMQKVPVDQIPNGDQLPVGQTIYMMGQSGQPFPVRSIEDGIATFDTNHELVEPPPAGMLGAAFCSNPSSTPPSHRRA